VFSCMVQCCLPRSDHTVVLPLKVHTLVVPLQSYAATVSGRWWHSVIAPHYYNGELELWSIGSLNCGTNWLSFLKLMETVAVWESLFTGTRVLHQATPKITVSGEIRENLGKYNGELHLTCGLMIFEK
jgi:hypothetical protein